ncbi:hypothetical protein GCM10027051_05320 [Niabella terrae]
MADHEEGARSADSEPVSISRHAKANVDKATNLIIGILHLTIANLLYVPLHKRSLIQSLGQAIKHSAVDKEAILREPVNQFLKAEVPLKLHLDLSDEDLAAVWRYLKE